MREMGFKELPCRVVSELLVGVSALGFWSSEILIWFVVFSGMYGDCLSRGVHLLKVSSVDGVFRTYFLDRPHGDGNARVALCLGGVFSAVRVPLQPLKYRNLFSVSFTFPKWHSVPEYFASARPVPPLQRHIF